MRTEIMSDTVNQGSPDRNKEVGKEQTNSEKSNW